MSMPTPAQNPNTKDHNACAIVRKKLLSALVDEKHYNDLTCINGHAVSDYTLSRFERLGFPLQEIHEQMCVMFVTPSVFSVDGGVLTSIFSNTVDTHTAFVYKDVQSGVETPALSKPQAVELAREFLMTTDFLVSDGLKELFANTLTDPANDNQQIRAAPNSSVSHRESYCIKINGSFCRVVGIERETKNNKFIVNVQKVDMTPSLANINARLFSNFFKDEDCRLSGNFFKEEHCHFNSEIISLKKDHALRNNRNRPSGSHLVIRLSRHHASWAQSHYRKNDSLLKDEFKLSTSIKLTEYGEVESDKTQITLSGIKIQDSFYLIDRITGSVLLCVYDKLSDKHTTVFIYANPEFVGGDGTLQFVN